VRHALLLIHLDGTQRSGAETLSFLTQLVAIPAVAWNTTGRTQRSCR
jgi:hypothetical protein